MIVGIAQRLERHSHDQKVTGFKTQQERQDNVFCQGQLSVLTPISVSSFHPMLPQ